MTQNNGVILERLSGKKLSILVGILVIFQIIFLLIGCLKFPNATHTESVEGIMCKEKIKSKLLNDKKTTTKNDEIYYLRDYIGRTISNCERVQTDEHKNVILDTRQDEIVYAFQIPLPRDNRVLKLHRFFQTMTAILQFQVLFPPSIRDNLKFSENDTAVFHDIPLNVKLAYRNSKDYDDDWHLIASNSKISKKFKCYKNIYSLDCDVIQLFELGSVHHEFYAINIKLGESAILNTIKDHDSMNKNLYVVKELPEARLVLTFIYQTGGFTQMWLIMKSCVLPFVFILMCWFWNRIVKLDRKSNLIERMLFSLGLATTLLNLPVEWLTLYFDLKFMLLYSDLRQGIFYCTLFTFWIVFCGEHFIDENQISACSTMKSYWKYVGATWFGFICLLAFELCERGMQLSDPFFSIWDSQNGSNLAIAILILACISCAFYFGLLLYLVFRVYFNFRSKQSQLPAMSKMRRAYYEGIIYRFKFLLAFTLFCAAMTISYFIMNNINESQWQLNGDDGSMFNYTGGFFAGVYGLWNIYVSAVMIFYAPSHKNKLNSQNYDTSTGQLENDESIEFVNLQTRLANGIDSTATTTESVLTAFANKISAS